MKLKDTHFSSYFEHAKAEKNANAALTMFNRNKSATQMLEVHEIDAFVTRLKQSRDDVVTTRQLLKDTKKPSKQVISAIDEILVWARGYIAMVVSIGPAYSGDYHTLTNIEYGIESVAYSSVSSGERYSRKCYYKKNDVTHIVKLSINDAYQLYLNRDFVEASRKENIPIISINTKDGIMKYVKLKNKQLTTATCFYAYDAATGFTYHSDISVIDAQKKLAKKIAVFKREKAATRRTALITRLCNNVVASIPDAKELHFCDNGIKAFQVRYNIGDIASLPSLIKTGDKNAIRLALHVARKMVHSNKVQK